METRFDICDHQFTVKETAAHLKVSRSFLYQLIRDKQIKTAKLGTRTIVPGVEVQRFVKAIAIRAA
jgi:excisionase family DNA binding protein